MVRYQRYQNDSLIDVKHVSLTEKSSSVCDELQEHVDHGVLGTNNVREAVVSVERKG